MQDVAFVRSPLAHARIRGDRHPRSRSGPGVHRCGSGRRQSRSGRCRACPASRSPSSRRWRPEGAACRRADRHVRRPDARRSRGYRGKRRGRPRGVAGRPRHAGGAPAGLARLCTSTGATTSFSRLSSTSVSQRPSMRRSKSRATISTARQCMAPIEGRGIVACSTTAPTSLFSTPPARCRISFAPASPSALAWMKAASASSRPTSAAASATKAFFSPEEVCLGWLAMRCGHPVRWLEDRREHLTANANCREHHYRITVYADRDGTLRGVDCEATVDLGAYSAYPFTACLEAAQVASILPGPYDFPSFRCRAWSVATNKCPILPYRGVARTGVCYALELVLDLCRAGGRHRAARGAARKSWSGPSRCRSTTSPKSISTAATIPRRCARATGGDRPRSAFASVRGAASPTAA